MVTLLNSWILPLDNPLKMSLLFGELGIAFVTIF
jgi:hypothetical protein